MWAMLLCPSNTSAARKREIINAIWRWSDEAPLSAMTPYLSDDVLAGIGSGGPGYNNHRWRELVFIIKFVGMFKAEPLESARNCCPMAKTSRGGCNPCQTARHASSGTCCCSCSSRTTSNASSGKATAGSSRVCFPTNPGRTSARWIPWNLTISCESSGGVSRPNTPASRWTTTCRRCATRRRPADAPRGQARSGPSTAAGGSGRTICRDVLHAG